MSRRVRAIGFGALALLCAVLAAAMAAGYRGQVTAQLGPLRPVVVARADLPRGQVLDARDARRLLEVRRVPARFVPPGALVAPGGAVGQAPLAPVPAGSYLLSGQLRPPGRGAGKPPDDIQAGREPLEIAVSGAAALGVGGDPTGARVDVIVTSEPGPGGGPGRTYVAARDVQLLGLSQAGDDSLELPAQESWTATIAVTRRQALRLIHAESFARQVRLIRSG